MSDLKRSAIAQLEGAFACLRGIKELDPKVFTPEELAQLSKVGAGIQQLVVECAGAKAARPVIHRRTRRDKKTLITGIQPDAPPSPQIEVDTDGPTFGV